MLPSQDYIRHPHAHALSTRTKPTIGRFTTLLLPSRVVSTGAQFGEATQATEATFTLEGTAFAVRVQGQPTLKLEDRVLNGDVQPQAG
ncbi:MAG UNVERIFIED_CONTAM: hypothetical protein LVT10_21170 [Anaerolineae bacterium]|jgi:hypothetical protein